MNKTLASVFTVFAVMMIGCKQVPTPESLEATSKAVGVAAAMVANKTSIDDTSRNVIIDIMNEVESCIPETNQTFETAWTPIAEKHTKKLLDEGKITEAQQKLILGAFSVAIKGVDYIVTIRYPKIREYQELIEAASHGFCDGFLSIFKPANTVSANAVKIEPDKEAYDYLLATMNIEK